MAWVAVATVRDEGAAEATAEALEDADIQVNVKHLPPIFYLGNTTAQIEVRVLQADVERARSILDQLSSETEAPMLAEAGAAPLADETYPAIEDTPRKISWALGLALVTPIPFLPAGMMYARAPRLITFTLLGIGLGVFGLAKLGFSNLNILLFIPIVGIRLIDMVLAPIFAVVENRRIAKKGIEVPHTKLPPVFILVMVFLVLGFAVGSYMASVADHKEHRPQFPIAPPEQMKLPGQL